MMPDESCLMTLQADSPILPLTPSPSGKLSFERWLLTWMAVLFCHTGLYATFYPWLIPPSQSSSAGLIVGLVWPLLSSMGVLALMQRAQKPGQAVARWSDAIIALHIAWGLVLLVLSQGHYLTIPSLASQTLIEAVTEAEVWRASASLTGPRLAFMGLMVLGYGFSLLMTLRLASSSRFVAASLQSAVLLGLLLALPLSLAFYNRSETIDLEQTSTPDIEFAWQALADGCVEYRFSAEGVRAIWLGEEGLASVEPMNYNRYCDSAPRLLRIITNDDQEHLYIVGNLWAWPIQDAWWQAVAVALIVPLLAIHASLIERYMVSDAATPGQFSDQTS